MRQEKLDLYLRRKIGQYGLLVADKMKEIDGHIKINGAIDGPTDMETHKQTTGQANRHCDTD